MKENFQNYKHREQDKKEISPLVDGQSYNDAEKDKRIKKTLPENYK